MMTSSIFSIRVLLLVFVFSTFSIGVYARTPNSEEIETIQKIVKRQLATDLLSPDSYSGLCWNYVFVEDKHESYVYFTHEFTAVTAGNIKRVCVAYGSMKVEESGQPLDHGNRPYKFRWGTVENEKYNFRYMNINGKFKNNPSNVLIYREKRTLGGKPVE